jgi:CDGSH-type Zn-finger protein/uncharacterized Fe-S cluster protein YjdI
MADDIEQIPGPQATIRFDAKKCIHSRHCVLDRPDVFVPNVVGAWIHPEVATGEEIAEIAHNCPSGAITSIRHDGGPQEVPPRVNLVNVRENGPLAFHGELTIDGCGNAFRATLCRCGKSATKPFCDQAHARNGFAATGEPATVDSQLLARRDGHVTITPLEDGPLAIAGSLELVSGTGRTINRCVKTALCRCGGSQNKPYCDGTHTKIGFRAPAPGKRTSA